MRDIKTKKKKQFKFDIWVFLKYAYLWASCQGFVVVRGERGWGGEREQGFEVRGCRL